LGADSDGELYTLRTVDLLDTSTRLFRAACLLVGKHFSSVEEISFNSALVAYSNLEEWSCFRFTRPCKSDSPDCFRIEVPNQRATLFRTNAAGPIRELSREAYAVSRFARRVVKFRPNAEFKIELNNATDLKGFFSLLGDLGQFTTMLIGEPSYLKKVRFLESAVAIDAFFRSDVQKETEASAPVMCFPLADVHGIIQMLAENWFNSLPVYDLLFGTLFNRDSFVQTKFLNLVQAIESFHRRVLGGTYLSHDEYAAIQSALSVAVPAGVPDPLKRRLSDSINYANEYSLRKRLKELLFGLDGGTVESLKISDVAGITELIVKTRNYLTHFDEESKTSLVGDIAAMHYMNERLTALLFILVLKRLGM
jgi:hypothetical protein